MKAVIYSIVNSVNKKVYVGSTENYSKRKRTHISSMNKGKASANINLLLDWLICGQENFHFSILEYVNNIEDIIKLEDDWVIRLDSINNGYNEDLPSKRESYESRENKKKTSSNSKTTNLRKKKVYQFDKNTFELIKIFESRADLIKECNISYQSLIKSLKANTEISIKPKIRKGFIFISEENYIPEMNILKKYTPSYLHKKELKEINYIYVYNKETGEEKKFASYSDFAKFLNVNIRRVQELKKGIKNTGRGYFSKITHLKGWKLKDSNQEITI